MNIGNAVFSMLYSLSLITGLFSLVRYASDWYNGQYFNTLPGYYGAGALGLFVILVLIRRSLHIKLFNLKRECEEWEEQCRP